MFCFFFCCVGLNRGGRRVPTLCAHIHCRSSERALKMDQKHLFGVSKWSGNNIGENHFGAPRDPWWTGLVWVVCRLGILVI